MTVKYLAPGSVEDWLRREVKSHHRGKASVIWKALVKDFLLASKWVAWKVGKGDMVKISEDPWMGCLGNCRLS